MANPANAHPILNPPSPGTSAGPGSTRPASGLSGQLAYYNISTQTVAQSIAPKLVGMVIIWVGQRIFNNIFRKKK